jgi:hypothetical protein
MHELALAVYLRDIYSGKAAIGRTDVSLIKKDEAITIKGKANPSNYYVFLQKQEDLNQFRIRVMSEFYHEVTIDFEKGVGNTKLIDIGLSPRPSYPFRSGETLARGLLSGPCGIFYGNAEKGSNFVVSITERCEFVIWFKNICNEDLVINNKKFFSTPLFFFEKAKKEIETEINDNNTGSPSTDEPKERGKPLCRPVAWDRKRDMN